MSTSGDSVYETASSDESRDSVQRLLRLSSPTPDSQSHRSKPSADLLDAVNGLRDMDDKLKQLKKREQVLQERIRAASERADHAAEETVQQESVRQDRERSIVTKKIQFRKDMRKVKQDLDSHLKDYEKMEKDAASCSDAAGGRFGAMSAIIDIVNRITKSACDPDRQTAVVATQTEDDGGIHESEWSEERKKQLLDLQQDILNQERGLNDEWLLTERDIISVYTPRPETQTETQDVSDDSDSDKNKDEESDEDRSPPAKPRRQSFPIFNRRQSKPKEPVDEILLSD